MDIKKFNSGQFVEQFKYKSFSPTSINIDWELTDLELISLLSISSNKLGELNAYSQLIPDIDFFINANSNNSKLKDTGFVEKGLINILNGYKFTVAENTPVEEEIALDPELLGRIFENLLASYNPETGTTARKQTGSFYTPREIVNYMVDESLIAYLENCLNRDLPDLYDENDLEKENNQDNHNNLKNQSSDNKDDEKIIEPDFAMSREEYEKYEGEG